MLGLQCDGLAVAQRLAVLSTGRAVEEVSAIELKSWLVGEHLKKTTALWLIDGSIELHSALRLAVNAEIVVVACPVRERKACPPPVQFRRKESSTRQSECMRRH